PDAKGFTDDNASWLKLKGEMDDEEEEELDSDDDDDLADDFGGATPKKALMTRMMKKRKIPTFSLSRRPLKNSKASKRLAKEDEAEMKLNFSEKEIYHLPSGQELEKEASCPPDL
ncbi:Putative trna and rrna cytosine-c5-methylase nucleolar protein nol1/nop2, partial [Caligus rogercresseyi]